MQPVDLCRSALFSSLNSQWSQQVSWIMDKLGQTTTSLFRGCITHAFIRWINVAATWQRNLWDLCVLKLQEEPYRSDSSDCVCHVYWPLLPALSWAVGSFTVLVPWEGLNLVQDKFVCACLCVYVLTIVLSPTTCSVSVRAVVTNTSRQPCMFQWCRRDGKHTFSTIGKS